MADGHPLVGSLPTAPQTGPPGGTPLRTLRGLADYRCGHSGSCCRAGWPIPIEPEPLALLRQAECQLALPRPSGPGWLDDDHIIGRTTDSKCVFLGDTPAASTVGNCRLERALGAEALPHSCRQFPRILLVDGRGWHVSLSAWCGTAAARIASAPGGDAPDDCFMSYDHIPADGRVHVEALDAREAWPPLLRPGVLAGLDAYDVWEARALQEFLGPASQGGASLQDALVALVKWTDWAREWRASEGSLVVRLHKPRSRGGPCQATGSGREPHALLNDLLCKIPMEWRPAAWPDGLTDARHDGPIVTRAAVDAAMARYLATRLVGSWVAYQGDGLRSVLASLVSSYTLAALALSHAQAAPTIGRLTSCIRAADWIQLHLLDRAEWAKWCSGFEGDTDGRRLVALVQAATSRLDQLPLTP